MARALSIALAILISAQVAAAQTTDAEARARFESGRLAYEAGRYEEALADFTRSYELSGRPLILYNIGLVNDRLRRDAEALDAYERYLAAVPDAEHRAELEARVSVLRRAIEEEEARRASASEIGTQTSAAASSAPIVMRNRGLYEIGGWVAGGLAIAAGIGAGALWAVANDQYNQLAARCGNAGCTRGEIDGSGGPGLVVGTNVLLVSAIVSALCSALAWTLFAVDLEVVTSTTALRVGPGSLELTF